MKDEELDDMLWRLRGLLLDVANELGSRLKKKDKGSG